MQIHVYHSSSAGNLYRADDLLLEAGVSIREIKRALEFRLSEIRACLITHEHGDHIKGARDLMKAGVDIYCSEGTAHSEGLKGHRLHILKAGVQASIGPYKVMPFEVKHDGEEPLGFLIVKGQEKLLFVTDTNYIPFKFKNLTHIMIGVDYDSEILKENTLLGTVDPERAKRTLQNHMSLSTALQFFRANDMSQVQAIYLIHLSDSNSNAEQFKRSVERVSGRPVYI
ncbi:MAG: MBL fold metallo-hydrolase [Candidatus Omnitrophota bacterium]|jgi:phosphoribosyl 1,2-cyclic phosphodiesterase